jgi:hypothetical protein
VRPSWTFAKTADAWAVEQRRLLAEARAMGEDPPDITYARWMEREARQQGEMVARAEAGEDVYWCGNLLFHGARPDDAPSPAAFPTPQPEDPAPAREKLWDSEEQLKAAYRDLQKLHNTKTSADPAPLKPSNLREFVETFPATKHCRKGKRLHLSSRELATWKNVYQRCKRADCPFCTDYWMVVRIATWLKHWDGAQIYRTTFTSEKDWQRRAASARGTRVREGAWVSIRVGNKGERTTFSTVPEGEPVESPGPALLEALLRAPASTDVLIKGKKQALHRHSGIKVTEPKKSGDWTGFPLPKGYTLKDMNDLCLSVTPERAGDLEEMKPSRSISAGYKLENVSEEEMERKDTLLEPVKQLALDELAAARDAAKERRSEEAANFEWAAALPEGHWMRTLYGVDNVAEVWETAPVTPDGA